MSRRRTKGELEVEQLEELYRLRRKGRAPLNTDQRFALAFAYLERAARQRNTARLDRAVEGERKEAAPAKSVRLPPASTSETAAS